MSEIVYENKEREEKIRSAIKVECDLDGVGEDDQGLLRIAYNYLYAYRNGPLTMYLLTRLFDEIEPGFHGEFRKTEVAFDGCVGGNPPSTIERAIDSWIEWFNHECDLCDRADSRVEQVIKEFLNIYPFDKGNRRLAWLLRVWLLDQWDDPQPLPDYCA